MWRMTWQSLPVRPLAEAEAEAEAEADKFALSDEEAEQGAGTEVEVEARAEVAGAGAEAQADASKVAPEVGTVVVAWAAAVAEVTAGMVLQRIREIEEAGEEVEVVIVQANSLKTLVESDYVSALEATI
jgi:hypothetical protein